MGGGAREKATPAKKASSLQKGAPRRGSSPNRPSVWSVIHTTTRRATRHDGRRPLGARQESQTCGSGDRGPGARGRKATGVLGETVRHQGGVQPGKTLWGG